MIDTQEIIDRANHAVSFKKEVPGVNSKDKYQSSAGRKGYSLRAMKRKEDAEKKNEVLGVVNVNQQNLLNNQQEKPNNVAEKFKASSPIEGEIDNCVQMIDEMFGGRLQQEDANDSQQMPSRKPKFLMNKLTNLMRDTKSSAQRNKYKA